MISDFKKQALASLQGKWGFSAGVTFLYYLIAVGGIYALLGLLGVIVFAAAGTDWQAFAFFVSYFVYIVAALLLSGIMSFGILKVYLQLAKREDVGFGALFDYFRSWERIWTAFKVTFFIGLYTFLWSLLLVIPGIIKAFSYSMTYYILLENPQYTVHEAIAESRRIMDGRKMDLFLLFLSFIGWCILAAFTFGIAYLWLTPYINTAMAHFYLKASKGDETEPEIAG
ncbi:MAG: DUF975 family protein [Ectobacillus sp.]